MQEFTIVGVVETLYPEVKGVSKLNGTEWRRRTVCVRQAGDEMYPKELALDLKNEDIDRYSPLLKNGSTVRLGCSIASRSFNGKWYTDVRCVGVEVLAEPVTAPAAIQPRPQQMPPIGTPAASRQPNLGQGIPPAGVEMPF